LNIEKVVQGCKDNDRKSQDELVQTYAPVLMAICYRYCNDQYLAQDALQETFINIFKYIKKYSGQGSFEGWMKRIAVNCSFAIVKKVNKVNFYEEIELQYHLPTDVPDVYSQLNEEVLLKLIARLPKNQQIVFNMKVIEGFSHDEIAKMLKIKPSTSRSNLVRARLNLLKQIEKSEYIVLPKAISK